MTMRHDDMQKKECDEGKQKLKKILNARRISLFNRRDDFIKTLSS